VFPAQPSHPKVLNLSSQISLRIFSFDDNPISLQIMLPFIPDMENRLPHHPTALQTKKLRLQVAEHCYPPCPNHLAVAPYIRLIVSTECAENNRKVYINMYMYLLCVNI
jgi:hypothetical protein